MEFLWATQYPIDGHLVYDCKCPLFLFIIRSCGFFRSRKVCRLLTYDFALKNIESQDFVANSHRFGGI